jgi:GNAT superfamily N-acetyltransferase
MTQSEMVVKDKEGHPYRLEIDESDHDVEMRLLDGRTWIGKVSCLLRADEMELADIIIWERTAPVPRGLWWLVPYRLYFRLKGKNNRRRGLGTELLKLVIAKARERDLVHIRGFVTNQGLVDNPNLLNWYKKHGFDILPTPSPGSEMTDKVAWIRMDLK